MDTAADLSLIYGMRQRADTLAATHELLAAQRSAVAVERQRLAIEESRRQAEADERRTRQQTLEQVTAARKLLCKFEQNLELLEQRLDSRPENIVTLAIIEENAKRLESIFCDLNDIRALSDVARRTARITDSLLAKGTVSSAPSEMLKRTLPELESIFKAARDSIAARLFVHPKYQSEVIKIRSAVEQWKQRMDKLGAEFDTRWKKLGSDLAAIGLQLDRGRIIQTEYFLRRKDALLSKAARLEAVRNDLLEFCQKAQTEEQGYFEKSQHEEARFTFNNLPSQIDPSRNVLLTTWEGGSIDPFEVDQRLAHVKSLREGFDAELESLRARLPEICVCAGTDGPNKNISFFVTSTESAEQQYPHAACLDFYEFVAREGRVYGDISAELVDVQTHLERLLDQYTEQCRQIEQVNKLVQDGNVLSAKRIMTGMNRVFTVVRYRDYDQAIEQHSHLLSQAEDLERRVQRTTNTIIGALTPRAKKGKLRVEYYQLSHTAETLADCELKTELLRRLASIKSIGGFS